MTEKREEGVTPPLFKKEKNNKEEGKKGESI